jgi:hypothetical protein
MEKIKDPKVRHATLDHFHMVMLMSINPDETIKSSRHMGGRWWWKILIIYNLVLLGQDTFGPIIANLISNLLLSKYVFKPFKYGCITSCMLTFHTYTNYIMGCKYFVHVHAKLLDGWASSSVALKSRHAS